MKIKIQELDSPTVNGRIYNTDSFQSLPEMVYGYLSMPVAEEVTILNLSRVSHFIKNLRIEDSCLVGDVTILDTPCGKVLADMINEHGLEVDYRLAGVGKVNDPDAKVTNFTIHSINVVPVESKSSA